MNYDNRQDWPEKMDINRLITRPEAIAMVKSGEKSAERRNDRYADPGDELVLDGETFLVDNVYPQKLKDVTEEDAKREGFSNLDAYKNVLTSIHHGAVWDPEKVVWVHELKRK